MSEITAVVPAQIPADTETVIIVAGEELYPVDAVQITWADASSGDCTEVEASEEGNQVQARTPSGPPGPADVIVVVDGTAVIAPDALTVVEVLEPEPPELPRRPRPYWPSYGPECGILRLELDTEILDLIDADTNGLAVTDIDLGAPAIREVTAALPTRDGSYDTTRIMGPRVVTITGNAVSSDRGTRGRALDNLLRYCTPRRRPRLVYALDDDVGLRMLSLRVADWSAPFRLPERSEFSVSWVAPDPVAYSVDERSASVFPEVARAGTALDFEFDLSFPYAEGGAGVVFLDNDGDYATWPLLRIFGPCDNPAVIWQEPPSGGFAMHFTRLNAGDWIDVDLGEHSVLYKGQPGADRYAFVDFQRTTWPALEPGPNQIRFNPQNPASPCQLHLFWRDAWL